MSEIISRKEAREKGLIRYFSGVPCARGHLSERLTNCSHCLECERVRQRARSSDPRVMERKRNWHRENKAYGREYSKKWRAEKLNDPETGEEYKKEMTKRKREAMRRNKRDPRFRAMHNAGKRLKEAVLKEYKRTVGCDRPHFTAHIEKQFSKGMTWDNYGTVWHIDHVIPLSSFDLLNPEEVRRAGHYTNLQPMFAQENRDKSDSVPDVYVMEMPLDYTG